MRKIWAFLTKPFSPLTAWLISGIIFMLLTNASLNNYGVLSQERLEAQQTQTFFYTSAMTLFSWLIYSIAKRKFKDEKTKYFVHSHWITILLIPIINS